jgi:hypothetical protein
MPGMVIDMSRAADQDVIHGDSEHAQTLRSAMKDYAEEAMTCVRATYDTGEVRFDLPKSATLAQLIEKVAIVGRGHGAPISVELLIKPTMTFI